MKTCFSCDNESTDDSNFCIYCGARFPVEGPKKRLVQREEYKSTSCVVSLGSGSPYPLGVSGLTWVDCVMYEYDDNGEIKEKTVKLGVRLTGTG